MRYMRNDLNGGALIIMLGNIQKASRTFSTFVFFQSQKPKLKNKRAKFS